MAQGPMSSILVTIRITVRIRESVPDRDPDHGKNWRSAEVFIIIIIIIKFF